MSEPARDTVSCCNDCPFLYVSLPYGQLRNRCLHPAGGWGEGGRKLHTSMFNVDTLKASFPPADRWDWIERLSAELGRPNETIESGFTPKWCPLKTTAVLVEWGGS